MDIILEPWLEELENHDSEGRRNAVWKIDEMAHCGVDVSAAVPKLVEKLGDENFWVRRVTEEALVSAAITGNQVVEPLSDASKNPKKIVRRKAIGLFNKMLYELDDTSNIVPSLLIFLKDKNLITRVLASRALSSLFLYRVDLSPDVPKFIDLLDDENWRVRKGAVSMLGKTAGRGVDIPGYVPMLIELLNDESRKVRKMSARYLKYTAKRGEDISEALPRLVELMGENIWGRKEKGKSEFINEMWGGGGGYAASVVESIIANKKTTDIGIVSLMNVLDNGNSNTKRHAGRIITKSAYRGVDISNGIPVFLRRLDDKESWVVRMYSVLILGKLIVEEKTSEIVTKGLIRLASSKNWIVKRHVCRLLSKAARKGKDVSDAIPVLVKLLDDNKAEVRGKAASTLGHAAKKGADVSSGKMNLLRRLTDVDQDVREKAATAIERTDDPWAILFKEIVYDGKIGRVSEIIENADRELLMNLITDLAVHGKSERAFSMLMYIEGSIERALEGMRKEIKREKNVQRKLLLRKEYVEVYKRFVSEKGSLTESRLSQSGFRISKIKRREIRDDQVNPKWRKGKLKLLRR